MMGSECKMQYCDCYNEDTLLCYSCSRNKNHEKGELADEYISNLDKMTELFEYLTDKSIPNGVCVKSRPKLSANKAWSLIWFLQEVTRCLPDYIERCDVCGGLYDSEQEGYFLDDQYKDAWGRTLMRRYWGFYCSDECAPNIEFSLR